MDMVFNSRKHQYKHNTMVLVKYRYHEINGRNNNTRQQYTSRQIHPYNKTNTHTNMGETRGLNNENGIVELKPGV